MISAIKGLQWRTAEVIVALIFLAICISAVLFFHPSERTVPLDAHFPDRPTGEEFAVLRKAYSGPPASWPRPRLLPGATFVEMAPLELHAPPKGTASDVVRIGSQLFEDPLLSISGQFACQSCHNRNLGWGDGLPTPFGHDRARGKRNAQSLFTVGYKSSFFWDGRKSSLEEQVLGPLTDHREMANSDLADLMRRINSADRYRSAFAAITHRNDIELDDVTAALAAYERTLERPTRFDLYMRGNPKALTDDEIWGLHLFRTKAGCANCHNGPTLTDGLFHNEGLSFFNRRLEDLGRYSVTRKASDAGKFLTPSLRHVSKTGPFMHNGIFPSLAGVIRFYEAGGGHLRRDQIIAPERRAVFDNVLQKSPQLKPFELTSAERSALLSYLNAL